MPFKNSKLNQRAAIWATIIIGSALVVAWTPHLIWPPNGTPNSLAFVLSIPGIIALVPGVLVTSFVRMIAYMLMHHAEIARAAAAASPNSTDTYLVLGNVDMHLSIPFICALVLDWIFYFLIARTIIKARAALERI